MSSEVAEVRRGAGWTAGVVAAIVIAAAFFQSRNDLFLDPRNLRNMAFAAVSFGLIAVGQTLLLRMRYIDPSAASVASLAGVIAVVLVHDRHWPVVAAMAMALLVGACAGGINGLAAGAAGGARYPALLATIGMLGIAEMTRYLILGDRGQINVFDSSFLWWAGKTGVVFLIATLVTFAAIAARSDVKASLARAGRSHDAADGSDRRKTKILGFLIVGVLAAMAGLADVARAQAVGPWANTNLGLASVAAAIVGGASIFGGKGGAVTLACGIVLVETVMNGMQLWGAEAIKVTLALTVVGWSALMLDLILQRRRGGYRSGRLCHTVFLSLGCVQVQLRTTPRRAGA